MTASEEYRDISFGYGLVILSNIGNGNSDVYVLNATSVIRLTSGQTEFTVSKPSEYVTRFTGNGQNGVYATMIRVDNIQYI